MKHLKNSIYSQVFALYFGDSKKKKFKTQTESKGKLVKNFLFSSSFEKQLL